MEAVLGISMASSENHTGFALANYQIWYSHGAISTEVSRV
jgi:hypothetical protein